MRPFREVHMTVATIPSSLQRGIGAVALGNLRFVPDREGLLDSGPGYACFEATLGDDSIVRLSASIDPAQPTVAEFNVPGGPWGTEIEIVGDVLSASADGRHIGRLPDGAVVAGSRIADVMAALREAAVAAGRNAFEFGPPAAGLGVAA
jgi:hypothetical protein